MAALFVQLTPKQVWVYELKKDREHLKSELATYLRMREEMADDYEAKSILTDLVYDCITLIDRYWRLIRENS